MNSKPEKQTGKFAGKLSLHGMVKENLAGQKKVRGIVIASDFTERLVYAVKVVPDLSLKRYQISFKFTDA
ncbi:MAG: hypothetical protein MN733_37045 [Nitrososphaera sp.]|nr:hypothetical protein [Nitrososphaera sp.]